ncbi:MAG TPA: PAS domain S-box protein [candidate division Zixibacteria bacterium]|nr:PAS domain S-box protein [candidate division Zixibacteria bacterium]
MTALVIIAATLTMIVASCHRAVVEDGYVQIEPVDDPGNLPYKFKGILRVPIVDSNDKPVHGQIVLYDSTWPGPTAMCIVADSWNRDDSLSALVFYGDLERRNTVSHINIRADAIDHAKLVDYNEDHYPDLAVVYSSHDSLFLQFLNEKQSLLHRSLLLTGEDRNGSGRWDGRARIMGAYDLNRDGRARELLIAVDVGYDLYPRCLICFDMDADTTVWSFPYAGTISYDHFYVRSMTPDAPPSIIFGLASKGNAATTDLMDDKHAYVVSLNAHGQLNWIRPAGSIFHAALPLVFDYGDDGSWDILSPHRINDDSDSVHSRTVLEIIDNSGNLIDSLRMNGSSYVNYALTADLFGDRHDEIVLSMSDGRLLVLNQSLQQIRKSKFYSPAYLCGINDFLEADGLELAVITNDQRLWIVNADLRPMATIGDLGKFNFQGSFLSKSKESGEPVLFVAVDGHHWYYTYSLVKTAWTSIFTRHPSLAFLLAFVPMALVIITIVVLWRRTRHQFSTIVRQKEHLDKTLRDLREARKELVEADKYRQTREALLASEQRFRELSDLLPQTVFEYDHEGRLTYLNRQGLLATGYSLAEMADGLYIHDLIEPVDGRTVDDIVKQRLSGTAPESSEFFLVRKDGHKFPAMSYATTIVQDGVPVGIRGISIDMTDQKEAERALTESEERYRNLVESAGDPIFTVDRDGCFLFMNSVAATQIGGRVKELVGKNMHDIFPPEVAAAQMVSIRQVYDSGSGNTFESTTTIQGKDVHYRTSLEPVRDANGEVVAVLGIARDISAIINMTQALRAERDFSRSLLATANSAIVCFDENQRITELNYECERLLGVSRVDAIGQRWTDLPYTNESEKDREAFTDWITDSSSRRYEGILHTADNDSVTLLWAKSVLAVAGSEDHTITIAVGQDITDLKQVEAALASSEERYRRIWETSGQAISLTDENGILRFVNPAYCRLFKYTEEELLGHYYGDVVLLDGSLELIKEQYQDVFHSDERFSAVDFNMRDKHGNRLWVEMSVSHIVLNDDRYLVTMMTDVTSRHEARQALRESEERFRTIAEVSAVAIIIAQPEDGMVYYANRASCELFGYSIEELHELNTMALYDNPDDRTRAIERLRSGIDVNNVEVIARRKNGERFWGLLTIRPLTVDGRPGLMGSLVDITERKKMEEALRESEERFRTIAEATPIPVAITRFPDGEIIYANPSLGPTFGYESEEMVGLKAHKLYDDLKDRERLSEMLTRDGRVNNYELVGIKKNGSRFWALLSLQIIRFRGEMAIFGGFIDVTERKETRLRLEQAAQEQYDQIKRVAGSLAHEIYNALFPATSSLDKLRDRLELQEQNELERNRRLLDLAEQAVHRAIDMTGLVKQYSRLETEKKLESVSLSDVMNEVIQANAEALAEADITVKNELPDDLRVNMFRLHAYSLLNNLTTNAVSALYGQPVRIITISVLSRTEKEVKIVYRDTGPGIPATARDSVFKAFYSTKPSSGTGLGLAMVRRIVELYGGSITLADHIDNGAEFVILLPFNEDNRSGD